jgi:hypothetical protein
VSIGRLSEQEQRILEEVERELCRDRRLDRELRTFRPGPGPGLARLASYRPRALTVALLCVLAVTLMVTGIVTSEPGVVWAFAAVWPVTLFAVFRLLCRWTEG